MIVPFIIVAVLFLIMLFIPYRRFNMFLTVLFLFLTISLASLTVLLSYAIKFKPIFILTKDFNTEDASIKEKIKLAVVGKNILLSETSFNKMIDEVKLVSETEVRELQEKIDVIIKTDNIKVRLFYHKDTMKLNIFSTNEIEDVISFLKLKEVGYSGN